MGGVGAIRKGVGKQQEQDEPSQKVQSSSYKINKDRDVTYNMLNTVNTAICSKSGKEYIKALYCHPAYLTYIQSTSGKMPDWMKHKLESRLLGEISITSDMQMTPPLWQKAKKN